jgi:hypothetical protein
MKQIFAPPYDLILCCIKKMSSLTSTPSSPLDNVFQKKYFKDHLDPDPSDSFWDFGYVRISLGYLRDIPFSKDV